MSKARWWNILDTLQDEVETPWRKSLCKVVSKEEGSLEDLEPDGLTKSNLWSDAPFMSFTTLSRIVRGGVMRGVMLLQSRAVSHDRTVPTDRRQWMCKLVGFAVTQRIWSCPPTASSYWTLYQFWFTRNPAEYICLHRVFFSQNFWWEGGELAFGHDFSVPVGAESDGGTHVGDGVKWGGTYKKWSAEAKNAPYSKIRANFGVLSIK